MISIIGTILQIFLWANLFNLAHSALGCFTVARAALK